MEEEEEKPSKCCKGGGFMLQCSLSAMLIALAGSAVFAAFGEDIVVTSIVNQTFLRGESAQPANHAVKDVSRASRPRTLQFVKMGGNVTLRARPTEPPALPFVPSFVQPQVNSKSNQAIMSKTVCAFPSFFLMGAQKCATTSLNELLTTVVPEIRSYESKETHYLDQSFRKKNFYENNLASKYSSSRGKKGGKDFCFSVNGKRGGYIDSTPAYLTTPPDGPRRLKSVVPDGVDPSSLKFLVVLREPVLRQISYMNMYIRNSCILGKGKKLPRNQCNFEFQRRQFEQTLKDLASARMKEASTPDRGMCAIGLKRWWSLWDRKQFLVMNYRDVVYNTSATLRRVSSFLGVDGSTLEGKPLPHKNTAAGELQVKISDISCSVIKQYHDFHAPYVRRLFEILEETAHQAPPEQTPFKEFENPLEMCRKD